MLEKEFEYYTTHQEELLKQYNGSFIVIVGESVVGNYPDLPTAYNESKKKYELGTFLIQQCTPGKDSYTRKFRSRVEFQ